MIKFTNESLYEIINILEEEIINLKVDDILAFQVFDLNLKNWVDLAQILYCKMLIPIQQDDNSILIQFQKLDISSSFHNQKDIVEQKYGKDSTFFTINKNEQTSFLYYYKQALKNVNIDKRIRILNLGVNKADEFDIVKKYAKNFKNLELVGIDYCQSAIDEAKIRLDDENISFICHDINHLEELNLEPFDLIITIGTLQSKNINFKLLFQSLVQNYLKKDGAMIMGLPNCRWVDGEMIYGAKVPNYNFSELSLMYSDVVFCKKYLQQKKFRVTITGKDYIFLTATSIRK